MYLFAHRVRSARGSRGINAARYSHAAENLDRETWTQEPSVVLDLLANKRPGKRVATSVAVAPGGNSVEAFLDVAGPDDTDEQTLRQALAAARAEVGTSTRHQTRVGLLAVVFSVNLGEADLLGTFDELAGAVADIFAAGLEQRTEPIVVVVQRTEDGWVFQLDGNSARRVRDAGGQPARVSIRYEVADDFRRVHGKLYPYAAQWVTGLAGEGVLQLGGARFKSDGIVVGEWPAPV